MIYDDFFMKVFVFSFCTAPLCELSDTFDDECVSPLLSFTCRVISQCKATEIIKVAIYAKKLYQYSPEKINKPTSSKFFFVLVDVRAYHKEKGFLFKN